jgi:hypothetical protein
MIPVETVPGIEVGDERDQRNSSKNLYRYPSVPLPSTKIIFKKYERKNGRKVRQEVHIDNSFNRFNTEREGKGHLWWKVGG